MKRRAVTYTVVPLDSAAASDGRLGRDSAERLAMTAELSRLAWVSSGRALPRYTRETIPFRLITLGALRERHQPESRCR